jgi:flagellar biosynthesis GTPase FlhF
MSTRWEFLEVDDDPATIRRRLEERNRTKEVAERAAAEIAAQKAEEEKRARQEEAVRQAAERARQEEEERAAAEEARSAVRKAAREAKQEAKRAKDKERRDRETLEHELNKDLYKISSGPIYYESMTELMDAVEAVVQKHDLKRDGIQRTDNDGARWTWSFYSEAVKAVLYVHVSTYRMPSGRYELVVYASR